VSQQQTLVLIKPDATERKLTDEILIRLMRLPDVVISKLRYLRPTAEQVERHLASADRLRMGKKISEACTECGLNAEERYGTSDLETMGQIMCDRIVTYFTSGRMVALVLSGPDVIKRVRDMIGHTLPAKAKPGTIRGDFSKESAYDAEMRGTAAYNLVHASDSPESAEAEIAVWFPELSHGAS